MKTDMKHKLRISGAVAAIFAVLAALPLVSAKVTEQNTTASWASRAADYNQSDMLASLDSDSLIGAVNLHMADKNASVRDAALISDIQTLDLEQLSSANQATNDKQCLAEAIYYEARSETQSGQKAVAEVVLNRVNSKHFPNTVCGVVYEGSHRTTGCQFSFTCDGSMEIVPNGKSWTRSKNLASHVLTGMHSPITQRSTHYHTDEVSPKWAGTLVATRQIGSHKFYRFKSRREHAISLLSVAP